MVFIYEDKLRGTDLDFSYSSGLADTVEERIRDDAELMAEIKEFCEVENKDDVDGKLSMKDYIDLKIDEMAMDAVDGIKMYVEFEMEAKL